mgnify:CR=1 FL=1
MTSGSPPASAEDRAGPTFARTGAGGVGNVGVLAERELQRLEPVAQRSRVMVAEFRRAIAAEGVTFLLGHADAIEHGTTYFIWREVLRQILSAAATRSVDAQRRYLEGVVAGEAELAAWLSLINDVLPLGFAEPAALRGMSEQARAESTLKVLLDVLHCAIAAQPVVLVQIGRAHV